MDKNAELFPRGTSVQGITRREWLAAKLMGYYVTHYGTADSARHAVAAADALLKELEK